MLGWRTLAAVASVLGAATLSAQSGTTSVAGTADIYLSGGNTLTNAPGGGAGTAPNQINLNAGTGRTLTVTATGTWGCAGSDGYSVDGANCAGSSTAINSSGDISGVTYTGRTMPLSGVFLGSTLPGSAPAGLTYGSGDYTASTFGAPSLGQVFFIGDGLTGTGTGLNQVFAVPDGASQLFLGVADAYGFSGDPGYYGDNVGSVSVAYNITSSTTTTPEPSELALLATGLIGFAPALRRRAKL